MASLSDIAKMAHIIASFSMEETSSSISDQKDSEETSQINEEITRIAKEQGLIKKDN